MPSSVEYSLFLEVALKSTALLGVAWLAGWFLRARAAAIRHQVWSVAFAALLLLPLLSMALPALRVPVASSLLAPVFVFRTNVLGTSVEPAGPTSARQAMSVPEKFTPWANWGEILMAIWAAGAAVSLMQMLIGWVAVERMRREAKPCRIPSFDSVKGLLGIVGDVNLLETARGRMPGTYGLFRPTIFVPSDAMGWDEERQRVVLLHELAHVRRRDAATQLLARAALALHWWNPLVWFAWREFLKERERAADDLVLGAGAEASGYASQLLEIARSMQMPAAYGWAALAMARRSQLEDRLLAILDSGRDRKTPRRATAIALAAVAMGAIIPLAALHAQSKATADDRMSARSAAAFLIDEGNVERGRRNFDQAKELFGKAAQAAGSGPEAATALIDRGEIELSMKDYARAADDFEKAQAADAGKTSEARMWMAVTQERQNNLATADGLYQGALAVEDPHSGFAATIMELYARLLQQEGKTDEAKKIRGEAADIRDSLAMAKRQPSGPDLHRIGGNINAPVLVSKVEPDYTEEARIANYDGTVLLSVEVGADGIVSNINVVRGLGLGLDQKAVEAVGQWRFMPATENGQPVKVAAQIEVNFRLL
jgi:TonB family protein